MVSEYIRVFYVSDREGGSLRNSNSLDYRNERDVVRESYDKFIDSFRNFIEDRRNQTLSGDSELEAVLEIKLREVK